MSRKFKVGDRLKVYPSSDRTYTDACTVKQILPAGEVVVIYDKPILGVRPTQTFRIGDLEKRVA